MEDREYYKLEQRVTVTAYLALALSSLNFTFFFFISYVLLRGWNS